MEFIVEPEPGPEEREAISLALERLLAGEPVPAAYRSAWRRAGMVETLGELGDGATAEQPRRHSRVEPRDPRQ